MQTLRTAEELSVLAVVWQGKVCFLSTLHHCSSSFLEMSTVRCKGDYLLSWEFSIPLKRCNNCSGLLDKGHTPPKTDRTFPENFQSYIESELSSLLSEFLQSLCALLKAFCLVLIRSTLLPCLHIGQCPRKGNFAVFLHLRAGKTNPFFFFSFPFLFLFPRYLYLKWHSRDLCCYKHFLKLISMSFSSLLCQNRWFLPA